MVELNYYQILEVENNCSIQEIKTAYRALAKENHPDVGGDPEKLKLIIEAYKVLSDFTKRKAYDEALHKKQETNDGSTEQYYETDYNYSDDTQIEELKELWNSFLNIVKHTKEIEHGHLLDNEINRVVRRMNRYVNEDKISIFSEHAIGKIVGRALLLGHCLYKLDNSINENHENNRKLLELFINDAGNLNYQAINNKDAHSYILPEHYFVFSYKIVEELIEEIQVKLPADQIPGFQSYLEECLLIGYLLGAKELHPAFNSKIEEFNKIHKKYRRVVNVVFVVIIICIIYDFIRNMP
jgi:curved DNA-binding protein CbpA